MASSDLLAVIPEHQLPRILDLVLGEARMRGQTLILTQREAAIAVMAYLGGLGRKGTKGRASAGPIPPSSGPPSELRWRPRK